MGIESFCLFTFNLFALVTILALSSEIFNMYKEFHDLELASQ